MVGDEQSTLERLDSSDKNASVELSIVIVNWRSKELLRDCLLSLSAVRAARPTEIIIIDGGSFDGCGEMLSADFPFVLFIQWPENVGFGRANNIACRHARGEFLWLLNPDTEVEGDAADALIATLRGDETVGLVGPKLLNSDGSLQTTCVQSLPTSLNQALGSELLRRLFPRSRLWGITALGIEDDNVDVEAVPGAAIMLKTSLFRSLNGFDEVYFMYGEDMDLCRRVQLAGKRVLYVPKAQVTHHGGGSSRAQSSKFSAVLMRVAVTHYLRSHGGPLAIVNYRALMALSAIVRIGALCLQRPFTTGSTAARVSSSLTKWRAVLNWAFGGERWWKNYVSKTSNVEPTRFQ